MLLFLALTSFAIAIAGFCAFVIFWPLALVHLRDRHPDAKAALGAGAFASPHALWWLLAGGYRAVRDPSFTGLATPAWVSLATILFGVVAGGVLYLWGMATQ